MRSWFDSGLKKVKYVFFSYDINTEENKSGKYCTGIWMFFKVG